MLFLFFNTTLYTEFYNYYSLYFEMARSNDKHLLILKSSPGPEHLNITGSRLPTYLQVLLCFLSQMSFLRSQDASNQVKQKTTVAKIVVEKVLVHYKRANIETKHVSKMVQDVQKLHNSYLTVRKSNRQNSIQSFQSKLHNTMPFWKRNTLTTMKAKINSQRTGKLEKNRISEDLKFLESMMRDRAASYSSKDKVYNLKAKERFIRKTQKPHQTLTPDDNVPCTSTSNYEDMDVNNTDINESPPHTSSTRSHKRTVKTGITLF